MNVFDFSEYNFNVSVKRSINQSFKFDVVIDKIKRETNKSYYQIISQICDINDIRFFEREVFESDFLGQKKFIISEILYGEKSLKSIKNFVKSKKSSEWFGKEILYALRNLHDKGYLKN
jgi:hypothetical protein